MGVLKISKSRPRIKPLFMNRKHKSDASNPSRQSKVLNPLNLKPPE